MTFEEAISLKNQCANTFIHDNQEYITVISPSVEKDRINYLEKIRFNNSINYNVKDFSTDNSFVIMGLLRISYPNP